MTRSSTNVETPHEVVNLAGATEADLRRQAVSAAQKALIDKYRDEFVTLAKAEAEKRGVTYAPRKTPAERAAEQIKALLADNPDLDLDTLRA